MIVCGIKTKFWILLFIIFNFKALFQAGDFPMFSFEIVY